MYTLVPGVDCPLSATFLGTTNNDDYGAPYGVPGTICIFERSIGDPSWRHYESFAQTPEKVVPAEGRAATELVFRYVATVGNYDVRVIFFLYIAVHLKRRIRSHPFVLVNYRFGFLFTLCSSVLDGLHLPARWSHADCHWCDRY